MPDVAINIFKRTAILNKADSGRRGNVIYLPSKGRLLVAGDLHGNLWAFDQVVKYASLANNPDTHLIFQEIIHGGPMDSNGGCMSFKLLIKAASLKLDYPNNVHFIMGNHDLSVIKDTEVLRGGKEMTSSFNSGVQRCYEAKSDMVLLAMRQMLFSQALAVKTQNGIFVSHSLPADRFEEAFDPDVLERPLTITDINRPNSAYLLLWGRDQSEGMLQRLAERLDVKFFVAGHQKQEDGFKRVEPNMLILACDHSNGSVVDIDMSKEYSLDELCGSVKMLIDLG